MTTTLTSNLLQKIIIYEQTCSKDGETPRDYYDPHRMLSETCFKILPNEEILCVINGSSFGYMDDTIVRLELNPPLPPPPATELAEQYTFVTQPASMNQLCLLVKNCSTDCSIYVGRRTPLVWLLDMPRIKSKMCFFSSLELTFVRSMQPMSPMSSLNTVDQIMDNEFLFLSDASIVIS